MNKKLTFLSVLTILLVSACSTTISSSSTITSSNQLTSSISTSNVEVVNNNQESNIIAIEVEKLPSKLVYTSNEVISTQGGQLRVVYADYRVKFVPITDNMIDTSRLDTSRVGTTNITLKYQEGEQVLFTRYQVSIVPFKVSLTGVEIDIKESDVLFEQSVDLNYIISPSNAIYELVEWSSSNPKIATVDNNGVVTPLNQGEVVITVTVDGKLSATSKLNILPMQPKEVEVNPTYVNLISQGWIPLSNATDLATIDNDLTATSYTFAQFTPYATTISNLNAASMLDKNYFLINDIDLSSIGNWTPLGTFTGELDGQGYAIQNLVINRTINNTGLFSIVDGVTIRNLNFNNAKINFNQSVPNDINLFAAGILAGRVNATFGENFIERIYVDSDSYIKFSRNLGGIIGSINSGNTRTVISNLTNYATIDSVFIDANNSNAGGIIGLVLDSKTEILNSTNYGEVRNLNSNAFRVGGIVGYFSGKGINNSLLINNTNYGRINGNSNIGGIAGYLELGHLTESRNFGLVGNINANNFVGGLVGWANSANVSKVVNHGVVNAIGVEVGGLVGQLTTGELSLSYNLASISGLGIVGGLVGRLTTLSTAANSSSYSKILNSYNKGSVSSTTTVLSNTGTGGVVGRVTRNTSTINLVVKNTYNYGLITDLGDGITTSFGGVIGYKTQFNPFNGDYVFEDNFFLNSTSSNGLGVGNGADANATALTLNNMRQQNFYSDWDFVGETINGSDNYWVIDPLENDGLPFLSWQSLNNE